MLEEERNALSTLQKKYANCKVEIFEDHVIELKIQKENLKKLPSEIVNFSHLQILDVQKNALEEIPSFLTNLKEIRHLDLTDSERLLPTEVWSQLY